MAKQWRETSFLARPPGLGWQVPVDVALERSEEQLGFTLEYENFKTASDGDGDVSASDSSGDYDSPDEAEITVVEARKEPEYGALDKNARETLASIQRDLFAMQRETSAIKKLLAAPSARPRKLHDVGRGRSEGEEAEQWQEEAVMVAEGQRGARTVYRTGITSTTSHVVYHEEFSEEIVTQRQPAEENSSQGRNDLAQETSSEAAPEDWEQRGRSSRSSYRNMIEAMDDTEPEGEDDLSQFSVDAADGHNLSLDSSVSCTALGTDGLNVTTVDIEHHSFSSSEALLDISSAELLYDISSTEALDDVSPTEFWLDASSTEVLHDSPDQDVQASQITTTGRTPDSSIETKNVITADYEVLGSLQAEIDLETVVKPYLETDLDSIFLSSPLNQSSDRLPSLTMTSEEPTSIPEELLGSKKYLKGSSQDSTAKFLTSREQEVEVLTPKNSTLALKEPELKVISKEPKILALTPKKQEGKVMTAKNIVTSDAAAMVLPEVEAPAPKVLPEVEAPAPKVLPEVEAPAPKVLPEVEAPAPKVLPGVEAPAPKVLPEVEAPAPKVLPEVEAPAPKVLPELEVPELKVLPEVEGLEPKVLTEVEVPKPKVLSGVEVPAPKVLPEVEITALNVLPEVEAPEPKVLAEVEVTKPKALKEVEVPEVEIPAPKVFPGVGVPTPKVLPEAEVPAPKVLSEVKVPEPKVLPKVKVSEVKVPEQRVLPEVEVPTPKTLAEVEVSEPKVVPEVKIPEPRLLPEVKVPLPKVLPETEVPAPQVIPEIEVPAPQVIPEIEVPTPNALPEAEVPTPTVLPEMEIPAPKVLLEVEVPEPKVLPEVEVLAPNVLPEVEISERKVLPEVEVPAPKVLPEVEVSSAEELRKDALKLENASGGILPVEEPEVEIMPPEKLRSEISPVEEMKVKILPSKDHGGRSVRKRGVSSRSRTGSVTRPSCPPPPPPITPPAVYSGVSYPYNTVSSNSMVVSPHSTMSSPRSTMSSPHSTISAASTVLSQSSLSSPLSPGSSRSITQPLAQDAKFTPEPPSSPLLESSSRRPVGVPLSEAPIEEPTSTSPVPSSLVRENRSPSLSESQEPLIESPVSESPANSEVFESPPSSPSLLIPLESSSPAPKEADFSIPSLRVPEVPIKLRMKQQQKEEIDYFDDDIIEMRVKARLSHIFEELEKMEVPHVPPPPSRFPPPTPPERTSSLRYLDHLCEATSTPRAEVSLAQLTEASSSRVQETFPIQPPEPSPKEPLKSFRSQIPRYLSQPQKPPSPQSAMSPLTQLQEDIQLYLQQQSPLQLFNELDRKTSIMPQKTSPAKLPKTSPSRGKNESPIQILKKLENMEIPEVPPPLPRQPPPTQCPEGSPTKHPEPSPSSLQKDLSLKLPKASPRQLAKPLSTQIPNPPTKLPKPSIQQKRPQLSKTPTKLDRAPKKTSKAPVQLKKTSTTMIPKAFPTQVSPSKLQGQSPTQMLKELENMEKLEVPPPPPRQPPPTQLEGPSAEYAEPSPSKYSKRSSTQIPKISPTHFHKSSAVKLPAVSSEQLSEFSQIPLNEVSPSKLQETLQPQLLDVSLTHFPHLLPSQQHQAGSPIRLLKELENMEVPEVPPPPPREPPPAYLLKPPPLQQPQLSQSEAPHSSIQDLPDETPGNLVLVPGTVPEDVAAVWNFDVTDAWNLEVHQEAPGSPITDFDCLPVVAPPPLFADDGNDGPWTPHILPELKEKVSEKYPEQHPVNRLQFEAMNGVTQIWETHTVKSEKEKRGEHEEEKEEKHKKEEEERDEVEEEEEEEEEEDNGVEDLDSSFAPWFPRNSTPQPERSNMDDHESPQRGDTASFSEDKLGFESSRDVARSCSPETSSQFCEDGTSKEGKKYIGKISTEDCPTGVSIIEPLDVPDGMAHSADITERNKDDKIFPKELDASEYPSKKTSIPHPHEASSDNCSVDAPRPYKANTAAQYDVTELNTAAGKLFFQRALNPHQARITLEESGQRRPSTESPAITEDDARKHEREATILSKIRKLNIRVGSGEDEEEEDRAEMSIHDNTTHTSLDDTSGPLMLEASPSSSSVMPHNYNLEQAIHIANPETSYEILVTDSVKPQPSSPELKSSGREETSSEETHLDHIKANGSLGKVPLETEKRPARSGKKTRSQRKKTEAVKDAGTSEHSKAKVKVKKISKEEEPLLGPEDRKLHHESGKRAMMEFYVNTLTSDSDTGSDSSTTASTTDSDTDNDDDEDGTGGRSYQVTAPGDGLLATIEEDAEEDSGNESSGHWLFSADNTDTDSVIHLPAVIDTCPPVHPLHHTLHEGESSGSEETLVVEDEQENAGQGVGSSQQQEVGVVKKSHALTTTAPTTTTALTTTTAPTTAATDTHYDPSAVCERDQGGAAGTGSVVSTSDRRRRLHEGRAGVPPTGRRPLPTMLGRAHVAATLYEQQLDDVFDFESLESCESVSGGSEASFSAHDNTSLNDTHLVFTTSATSQPFDDAASGYIEDDNSDSRHLTVQEEAWSTPSRPPHSHDETTSAPPHLNTTFVVDGSQHTILERSLEGVLPGLASTLSGLNGDEKRTEGRPSAVVNIQHVQSSTGHGKMCESNKSEGVCDDLQLCQTKSGPERVDLFGLPVRWTPTGAAHHPLPGAPQDAAYRTVLTHEEHMSAPLSSDRRPSDTGISPGLASSSDVTAGESGGETGVEVAREVSPTFTTHTGSGETSSEACHYQPPPPGNLLHHLSVPPQVLRDAGVVAPAGTGPQHDPVGTMRDATPSSIDLITERTQPPRASHPTQQPVDPPTTHHAHPPDANSDLPSGDSDTDTDNTDGDYDEEDHFSAEVSLRISVPSEAATAVKSFRSSDISQVSGGEGGGAGRGAAPEPRAASQSSSPAGVPDTVRWSECPSATDSLSEVSSLDASLTPISESATRPSLTEPATARPRRQHVLQTRMGRTRSCGDLRRYSESESEEEAADMSGLPQSVARLPQDAGTRPFKSTFATYIEQQHRQGEWHGATRSGGRRPRPPPAHPLSGSDASDEEVRSHYAGHRGHCRPRRHRSFHEAPPACRHEPQALRQVRGGTWAVPPPPPPAPLPGRRRPQPISVDLAEEFLSQESFKLPNGKQSAGKALGERICSVERGAPEQHPGAGTGPSQGPRPPPPSQQPGDGGTAIGVCGGGALPDPAGSRSEVRPPPPVLTPELTVQRAPPPLAPPPSQPPDHHPHQYSSTLAQLSNECHPVHTGHSSSGPTHDPPAATHDPPAAAHALTPAGSDPSRQCLPADTSVSPEMAEGRVRVRTKTYGTHGEVEVYLARADSGITPPHPSPVLTPTGGADHRPGSRGVTFSPSVKEVNWRESYYDVDPDEDTADAVDVRKVVVVTAESPRPQRVTVGTPPPALVPVNSTAVPENTAGNRASSPGHTVSALPEHISPAPNHATEPKHTSAEPKHIITVPGHIPTVSSNNVYNRPDKANGIASEQPVLSSSSDAELNGEKSPKVSTPIWQRFKLPKIPSPKAQRPKLPPKPQSLSSRSSDTESSKPSSPAPDSGSSTPSSPDNRQKKAPSSPRFFTWGNKRDKTRNLPRPLVSPPPPPAQGSTRQVRQELEVEVKGEPESSVSVGALSHEDGVGSCKSASGDCLVKRVVPRESVSAVKGLDRGGNYTHSATIGLNEGVDLTCSAARGVNKSVDSADSATRGLNQGVDSTYSATRGVNKSVDSADSATRGVDAELCSADSDASLESNRSPAPSVTSGDDSSDIGQLHSPRSAVSKPPLPPQLQQRPSQQVFHKARLLSARRQYFSQERQVSAPERSSPPKDLNDSPAPVAQPPPPPLSASRYNSAFDASKSLKERFEKFSASARAERERLAKSTPDLSVIEASVRRPGPRIDSCNQREQQQQQQPDSGSAAWASDGDTAEPAHAHHGVSNAHNKARAAIHERYKTRAQRIYARSRTQSVGVLETDLDTGASREVLTLQETNLDDLYRDLQQLLDTLPALGAPQGHSDKARAKSLLDLEGTSATMDDQLTAPPRPPDTRAKSMEFLLDDNNKASVEPPENELMKGSERQLSEAELRVRRSLQRLDVPEWMKNAQPQQQGFLLRRRDYGSSTASATGGGWSAYSSKTASMTSLGSSRAHTPNTPTKVVIPTRVTSRGMTGLGGVTSPASNCSISPSPSDRSGSLFQYPISRWSTSRLNSGTTTPTGSVTSTKSTATYTRQPYLGWRSQTSLASLAGSQSSLTNTGSYLTAADRLALGITAYSQRFVKSAANTQDKENSSAEANVAAPLKPDSEDQNDKGSTNGSIKLQVPDVADVHSSIKEVTSAIVHYCNESTPSPRASPRGSPRPEGRAPSPRRLVWVESSFVGSRPITSPETPTGSSHAITPTSQLNGHDLAESGEATSRPPQPPGEYLLAW